MKKEIVFSSIEPGEEKKEKIMNNQIPITVQHTADISKSMYYYRYFAENKSGIFEKIIFTE